MSNDFFSRQHIDSSKLNASAILAEQAIHCLELVSELAESGLPFQFKGGNSLLMLLEHPKRFSIDVDIATDQSRDEIEYALDSIIRYNRFYRWEKRQHKTKPWIPISSYYLFYRSVYEQGDDSSIMLDVQLRRSPYKTEFKPVVCGLLYKSPVLAEVPLPSSIIGDKLLTLGPLTLGIPLGKGKEAQRLKHVFDVSRLMNTLPLLSQIRDSFFACIHQENSIQQTTITADAIIKDTLNFCWSVMDYDSKPENETVSLILEENARGLEPFSAHLFDSGYSWSDLQTDMSKVALCISAMDSANISDEQFIQALRGELSGRELPGSVLTENKNARRNWEIVNAWTDLKVGD